MNIVIKDEHDIEKMRVAGRLASEVLDFIGPHVVAGVTTEELDKLCHDYMVNVQDTIPAPLNYAPPGYSPYPKSICTSVNHQICHGVPGPKKLKNGDIINIDITVIKDGYHGDTSRMFIVGEGSLAARRLCEITFEAMWLGIDQVKPGATLGDVGAAIQKFAEGFGYSVVREFCGHGIGTKFHEEPQVLHYGRPGTGLKLVEGMIFTIEPMLNAGKREIKEMPDGWTIVTKDHSLSAQWEHTVLVTANGYEVLTVSNGTPANPRLKIRLPDLTLDSGLMESVSSPNDLNQIRMAVKAELKAQAHQWLTPFAEDTPALAVETALRTRCKSVDNALLSIWKALDMPESYALIAVGGYGRGELFPFSDVDVLILIDAEPDGENTEKLETFCGSGWDIGLEIGHSVRTPAQCVEEAAKDITVQTALVESRFLYGNLQFFNTLNNQLQKTLDVKTFFRKKTLELRQRHAKYHETPYSLEPNCKESPGGLRDLHVISWISRAANLGNSWAEMAKQGLITPFEAAKLRNNERTLKKIRYQLHVTTGRREDRLVYDVQTQLAESLGYQATTGRRSSEQLMQKYYLAAKAVMQLNTILLQNIELSIFGSNSAPIPIDDEFQETDSLLDIRDNAVFTRNPSAMLRAFLVMQQNPRLKGMSARTLRQLWHDRVKINSEFRKDPVNKALFIDFFKQPRGIVHELRRMNEMSVLGRYLPVFRKIVGQMQHDLFHVYTVDQHIMTVVRNLRRFTMAEHAHEYPYCSQLMANFDDHWLLYIAALFHDVAKGRGGDHSVLGEVDARRFCKDHGLNEENTDLVAFLVKHHLTMSNTAQKKDLSDADVLREFAEVVKTPRNLTALYLLTVADIRGTSPKVWNAWKGKLLEDLYRLSLKYLGGEAPNRRQMLVEQQSEAKRILRLYALSDDVQEKLWAQLDVSYFLRQGASDIAWHTRHLYWRVNAEQPIVKARLSPIGEGLELLVYTRDEMDLFARICGYFDSKNLSILDAKIHTTLHGYALDSFLIQHDNGTEFYRETLSLLEAELQDRLIKRLPLEAPVFGRMSRQSRHFPVRPSVDLRPDEKGNQYLLTISATDRTGLLYSVTKLLAQYKVSVQTAKIMTLGERAEDSFLLYGQSLNSQKLQIQLETDLLELLSI